MNGVSLFANVGIAETYIKKHNINIVVANELLENRAKFYKQMHPNCNMIQGDITNNEIFILTSLPDNWHSPKGVSENSIIDSLLTRIPKTSHYQ